MYSHTRIYNSNAMNDRIKPEFAWYQDITPNQMFSLHKYPVIVKVGLSLCELHGTQLELKEVVLYHKEATLLTRPDQRFWREGHKDLRFLPCQ